MMAVYTPLGGKVPAIVAMYDVEIDDIACPHLLTARLPLLGVATMPQCRWKPQEFDEVAKLQVGATYVKQAPGASLVACKIKVERVC